MDRVFPAHSFKYTAALQAAQAGPNPILIRVETRAGHGGGMPLSKRLEVTVDQYAFFVRELKNECERRSLMTTSTSADGVSRVGN